jgi:hypothetical protein
VSTAKTPDKPALAVAAWEYASEDPYDAGELMLSHVEPQRREKRPLTDHTAATAELQRLQAEVETRDQALSLLAGLHQCVTTDEPQAMAQAIFDAVLSEKKELQRSERESRSMAEHHAATASQALKRAIAAEAENARLREALQAARECIEMDRTALADTHMDPRTNQVDEDGQAGLDEYDAVLAQIDSALSTDQQERQG